MNRRGMGRFGPSGQMNLPPYNTYPSNSQLNAQFRGSTGYGFDRYSRMGGRYGNGLGYQSGSQTPWSNGYGNGYGYGMGGMGNRQMVDMRSGYPEFGRILG